jgi:hypothetical protein
MRLELGKGFAKRTQKLFDKYNIEVGILNDKPYRKPLKDETGIYAGGPVRKKSREIDGTISEVSEKFRTQSGLNYLTEPFKIPQNKDILKFTRSFFKGVFGRASLNQMQNLAQAIIRNPILRGDYGSNSAYTRAKKGFDRYMFDTGQLFQAIKAKVVRR